MPRALGSRLPKPPNRGLRRSSEPDGRFVSEEAADKRSHPQRDRDRILYSGAFSRLAEIAQVVSPEKGYVFHNRLTHSLKVGQIARRLAESLNREQSREVQELGGLDPDAAEAAGLAHDLGHPPFGHIAEEELDRLVRGAGLRDGYEGNAQAFRIVVRLASSDACDRNDVPIPGLNLTRRTLDGTLKYPWGYANRPRDYTKKWGYYATEQDVFAWVRKDNPGRRRSVIAEIVDWADDITFAIHDLLDFYCAGRIPIDRCKGARSAERSRLIQGMFGRKPRWRAEEKEYVEALNGIVEGFPFEPDERYTDSVEDRAKLYGYSTGLIRYFFGALRIRQRFAKASSFVEIEPAARREVEVLKQFIWEYIIENPELAVPQKGQRTAIQTVFTRLMEASKTNYLFPPVYQAPIAAAASKIDRVRIVADCISGMTEKEVMQLYRSLGGMAT
jgi:dGTPase